MALSPIPLSLPQQYQNAPDKFDFIDRTFGFKEKVPEHDMPRSFRFIAMSQVSDGLSLRDRQIIALKGWTIQLLFTLAARAIFIVFSAAIFACRAVFDAFRFCAHINPEFKEISKVMEMVKGQWIDLGIALLSVPIGIAKTFDPLACQETTQSILDRYLERAERRRLEKLEEEREAEIPPLEEMGVAALAGNNLQPDPHPETDEGRS